MDLGDLTFDVQAVLENALVEFLVRNQGLLIQMQLGQSVYQEQMLHPTVR